MNLVLSCDFQVVEMEHPVHYQQNEFGDMSYTHIQVLPCALQKYSDGIIEALAKHLFFPGHLFSGLFLLSVICITTSFLICTLFDSHSFSILSCSNHLLHIHFLFDCCFFSRLSCTNCLCCLHFLSDSCSRSSYSISLPFLAINFLFASFICCCVCCF